MRPSKITGECRVCSHEIAEIVWRGSPQLLCPACGTEFCKVSEMGGFVYVAFNDKHPNHAKVGMTTKDPFERMKHISAGTGSIGTWEIAGLFPSYRPQNDEKKCHTKLKRYREKNEVFEIEPLEALLKVRSALQGREPIELVTHLSEEFKRQVEERRERVAHLRASKATTAEDDRHSSAKRGQNELFGTPLESAAE